MQKSNVEAQGKEIEGILKNFIIRSDIISSLHFELHDSTGYAIMRLCRDYLLEVTITKILQVIYGEPEIFHHPNIDTLDSELTRVYPVA